MFIKGVMLTRFVLQILDLGADLFTQWSEWTECDKKCGGGVSFRKRTCTNPSLNKNGADCSLRGSVTQTKRCNMEACPGKIGVNFTTQF